MSGTGSSNDDPAALPGPGLRRMTERARSGVRVARTTRGPRGARRRAVCLALVVASTLAGCGQGARRDQVDALRHSVPNVAGRTITGSFGLALTQVDVTGARQVKLRTGALVSVGFVADPGRRLSALQAKPGGPATYLSNGRSLFARRTSGQTSQRRPWVRLDVKRTKRTDRLAAPTLLELIAMTGPGNAAIVDPQLLIDLLSGALTGSIEAGDRLPDGTRPYSFNVSIDKANRTLRLPEDARKNRAKALRSLAISDDVFPARAHLRADGSLSRFSVTFTERPDKQAALELAASLEVRPSSSATKAAAAILAVPDRAATVRVPSLGDIGAALAARLGTP